MRLSRYCFCRLWYGVAFARRQKQIHLQAVLSGIQVVVPTTCGEQRFVGAALDNLAGPVG